MDDGREEFRRRFPVGGEVEPWVVIFVGLIVMAKGTEKTSESKATFQIVEAVVFEVELGEACCIVWCGYKLQAKFQERAEVWWWRKVRGKVMEGQLGWSIPVVKVGIPAMRRDALCRGVRSVLALNP